MHTFTHSRIHTFTNSHIYKFTIHSSPHSHIHTFTRSHIHTLTLVHSLIQSLTPTHIHPHPHPHAHTRKRAHALHARHRQTHRQTHTDTHRHTPTVAAFAFGRFCVEILWMIFCSLFVSQKKKSWTVYVRARESAQLTAGSLVGLRAHSQRLCCGIEQGWSLQGARISQLSTSVRLHRSCWSGREEDIPECSARDSHSWHTLGHSEFVVARVQATVESHRTLLERIQALTDLKSAWVLLLFYGTSRANCSLGVVHPCLTESFARQHDSGTWQRLCTLHDQVPDETQRNVGCLPLSDPRKVCRELEQLGRFVVGHPEFCFFTR